MGAHGHQAPDISRRICIISAAVPPGPQSAKLRAFHALEIAYVFGTFVWPFPWEDTDKKLSDAMTSYWVNFAASGNPNGGKPDQMARV